MGYCFWSWLIYGGHIITNISVEFFVFSKNRGLIATFVIGIFHGSKSPSCEVCMDLCIRALSLAGQPYKTETQNQNLNHKIHSNECHQWMCDCGCLILDCMQDQVDRRKCVVLCWTACTSRLIKDNVDVLFWTGRRQRGCFILDCMQKQVGRRECGCLFWSVFQDQVDRRQCGQDLHVLKTVWMSYKIYMR